jgi:CRISPR type I-E-associated protein CasB/Cse2
MNKPEETGKEFIEFLKNINSKALIADLKRGLVSGREFKAWPIISQWCNLENDRMRIITQTIAGQFVSYPKGHNPGKNFGASLNLLALRRNKENPLRGLKLFERHLNRIFCCSTSQEVCEVLGYYFRMMKSEGVRIDFERLYIDICYWSDSVRIRWAKGYLTKEVKDVSDTSNSK